MTRWGNGLASAHTSQPEAERSLSPGSVPSDARWDLYSVRLTKPDRRACTRAKKRAFTWAKRAGGNMP